jgi:hypothetical protein
LAVGLPSLAVFRTFLILSSTQPQIRSADFEQNTVRCGSATLMA